MASITTVAQCLTNQQFAVIECIYYLIGMGPVFISVTIILHKVDRGYIFDVIRLFAEMRKQQFMEADINVIFMVGLFGNITAAQGNIFKVNVAEWESHSYATVHQKQRHQGPVKYFQPHIACII